MGPIPKALICTCICLHVLAAVLDPTQARKFHINSINNVRKYVGQYPAIESVLAAIIQQLTFALMLCCLAMLVSPRQVFKVLTLLGVGMYIVLVRHFHVIVPDFYVVRDWLAIVAGIVYLMGDDAGAGVRGQAGDGKQGKQGKDQNSKLQ